MRDTNTPGKSTNSLSPLKLSCCVMWRSRVCVCVCVFMSLHLLYYCREATKTISFEIIKERERERALDKRGEYVHTHTRNAWHVSISGWKGEKALRHLVVVESTKVGDLGPCLSESSFTQSRPCQSLLYAFHTRITAVAKPTPSRVLKESIRPSSRLSCLCALP